MPTASPTDKCRAGFARKTESIRLETYPNTFHIGRIDGGGAKSEMLDTLSKAEIMALTTSNDLRRSAWIVCDEPSIRHDLETAASAAGLRPSRVLRVAEAAGALRDRPDGCLLVVDIAEAQAHGEEALLARIDVEAGWRERSAVISFGPGALDRVVAQVSAPHASLLCQPSMVERVAAMGFADAAGSAYFHEVDAVRDTLRLQQIADEVGRIARALAGTVDAPPRAVSDGLIGYRAGPVQHRTTLPQPLATVRADDVRAMIRLRRQRDRLFPADLFADPAWDMMLDLMAARIERLKVAVSSLCIAAAVPPTTALRWIRTLTEFGIFVRVADPTDGRRVFIELSDAAATSILDFLGEAKRSSAVLI